MISEQINNLTETCNSIVNVIPQTINWTNQYKIVPQENKKALKSQLSKYKRDTKRYKEALNKRPSIAIFGQSQVGKSYLVSNLVKLPEEEDLMIIGTKSDETIDFIEMINPPGDGKEATGIVSRFTVNYEFNTQYPYLLKLLSQADILRIIINGYFSDLMNYGDESYININEFQKILEDFQKQKKSTIQAGFSEDEVYDVKEYIELNFKNHHIADGMSVFWERIANIVPYIQASERWKIFDILWGKRQFFTNLFNKLTQGLIQLQHSKEIQCGLDATNGKFETIVDVERLRELYKPEAQNSVSVCLQNNEIVNIKMSIISALTAEIVLRLNKNIVNNPKRTFLKYADVLDFPGARSREKTPEATFMENSDIEKLQLFLRGKIAFLFDRYNYNHEISTLLYCHDNTPQNVKTIPHLIYNWIKRTHGGSPDERSKREQRLLEILPDTQVEKLIPLLFVLTKFNFELSKKEKDAKGHNGKWASRLKENFGDFMNQPLTDKWTTNWSNRDKTFKNTFLLRDPNPKFSFGVYDTDKNGNEIVATSYEKQLNDITTSFLSNENVKKHFRNPDTAWNYAVTPEKKGGINYIIEYLTPTCNPKIRIDRLKTLINEQKTNVIQAFENYVDSGDLASKLKKARVNGAKVFMTMMTWVKKSNGFGMFLDKLILHEDEAWKVYWNFKSAPPEINKTGQAESNEQSIATFKQYLDEAGISFDDTKDVQWHIKQLKDFFGFDDDESIYEVLEEAEIDIQKLLKGGDADIKTEAEIFAEMLIETWYSKVLNLKSNIELKNKGLSKNIIALICNTLDKSKERVGLKKLLANRVHDEVKHFSISNNYNIVAHIAAATINDYVKSLGWKFVDETITEYPKVKNVPIYSKQGVLTPKKEELRLNIDYPGMILFNEWNAGIKESFTANILFEEKAGNAEDALTKQKLNDILKNLH